LDYIVHPLIQATLASLPLQGFMGREAFRGKGNPAKRSVRDGYNDIAGQYANRVKDIAPGKPVVNVAPVINEPPNLREEFSKINNMPMDQRGKAVVDLVQNHPSAMEMMGIKSYPNDSGQGFGGHAIGINPNADEVFLAHELGHAASRHTAIGEALAKARNPKLGMALALGGGLTAAGAAGITPGDDDLDEAILGNIALASPVIAEEFLASKNGLAMMDMAGKRASLGQRGKLAGGLLTYLAAPISTAVLANTLGNQFDEDV
jgi:hypothetical protein